LPFGRAGSNPVISDILRDVAVPQLKFLFTENLIACSLYSKKSSKANDHDVLYLVFVSTFTIGLSRVSSEVMDERSSETAKTWCSQLCPVGVVVTKTTSFVSTKHERLFQAES
jgi:hypothetical protein